ncbi:MAG: sodium/solute symporter [Prevotellaceae bacterium]|jgi:SSS family transporter|nr:sodium/solute symporter [Prevotellaceae bacterium]
MTPLNVVDYIIFFGFSAGIVLFGCSFYFRNRSEDAFTKASGNMPAWVVAMSIFATFVSSISFLGIPGNAYATTWNSFVFSLSIPLASWLAAKFFVPLYRSVNSVSAYAYLEARFGYWARAYAAACYLLTQLARVGSILYLTALPLHKMFGWDLSTIILAMGVAVILYAMLGGITAVLWTDAIQGIILIAGALTCAAVLTFSMPDGPAQLFEIASAHHKFSLGSFGASLAEPTFWVVLVYGVFINLQNYGIDQNYVQRYMTARTEKSAKRSAFFGGMLYLPMSLVFFYIGTALFSYYTARPELLPEGTVADSVFPHFIINGLPTGVTGFLIAAIFAAGMSTISTSLNSSATVILTDFFGKLAKKKMTAKRRMAVLYACSLTLGALGVTFGLAMMKVKSALDAWWSLASIFSGGMLGLFLLGYLVKRIKSAYAGAAVAVGALIISWMSLPVFHSPFHSYLTIVFGTTAIFLVGFLLTALLQKTKKSRTKGVKMLLLAVCALSFTQAKAQPAVLKADDFKHYVDYFNRMEDENIAQAVPNKQAWEFLRRNIPLFSCPQDNFEEIYYFRWWSVRKHLKKTPDGYVFTEFLAPRSYADKHNMISSGLGHHIYELRWLHEAAYLNDYLRVWYRGNDGAPLERLRAFSSWTAYAMLNRYYVNMDSSSLTNMLPDLQAEYLAWEQERRLANGLFWQYDVRDAMEETISGGRREKNARPSINSYMYANANAIAFAANLAGNGKLSKIFSDKADTLKKLVEQRLWSEQMEFFETLKQADTFAHVREAIGYMPWYTGMVCADAKYNTAWRQALDNNGFLAPFGLTTAERRHPLFRSHGCCREKLGSCCKCEWDGAIWPFATSQTLTGMANFMNAQEQNVVSSSAYFRLMELYVESQYYRGRPYIGEYQDEVTGYWLKGDQERSRYYNHSTFADLVVTGLAGLRPRPDNTLEVHPLIPQDRWEWFCLDNVLYHGKILTIIWDKTGEKYNRGKGFRVLVDGKVAASSEKLEKITGWVEL